MNDLQLECRSLIADGKLGVAEDLTWFIALLMGTVVYMKFDSWWWAVAAAAAAYYFVTRPYRRQAAIAEDEYHRQVGLGKYYVARPDEF